MFFKNQIHGELEAGSASLRALKTNIGKDIEGPSGTHLARMMGYPALNNSLPNRKKRN